MNAPGIVCNGAALYDFQKGEYLETILLDESTRRRGQETLDRFPTLAVEAYHIDNVIHAVRPNLYTRQHEHVTHVSVVEKPSLLDVPLPLGKIMFEEDHAVLEEVKAFLQSQPWAGSMRSSSLTGHCWRSPPEAPPRVAWWPGLAERLGISRQHVYCAGDEANDLSMLTWAAEGFAPANCVPAVRACGATIVADADHDTLADIVSRLDKMYA